MIAVARTHPSSLVSCLMPTYNRRPFVPSALRYFERQDYPEKELIIVDDGSDPILDLLPRQRDRICYVRLSERMSLGAKRNLACELAQGDVIAHWDDDDWYAPNRLSYQVSKLREHDAEVTGLHLMLCYAPAQGKAWMYSYPPEYPFQWAAGSSLCYTRAFWQRVHFEDVNVAEDTRFMLKAERLAVLPNWPMLVALIHPDNTSDKFTSDWNWQPAPTGLVREILGDDWALYQ